MRGTSMRTLPAPGPLRAFVTRVAWGHAAENTDGDAKTVLVALPHNGDFGRGQAYLTWEPAITVAPGTPVSWTAVEGNGDEQETFGGTFTVDPAGVVTGDYPDGAVPPALATKSDLEADGRLARFELAEALERAVNEALAQRNRYIARELEGRLGQTPEGWGTSLNHGAADAVALENLATELLWGSSFARRDQKDSVVLRMIHKAATTSINNQPLGSWFSVNLSARAEEAIRRHIGDPHIGRKVRRLAREMSPMSIDHLLELYRRAHPRDNVGRERIIAALSAGKTIDSVSSSLSLHENVMQGLEETHKLGGVK